MKKTFNLVLAMILVFSLCACDNSQLPHDDNQQLQNNDLTKPVTNLEFWIAENVDKVDFSKTIIKGEIQINKIVIVYKNFSK